MMSINSLLIILIMMTASVHSNENVFGLSKIEYFESVKTTNDKRKQTNYQWRKNPNIPEPLAVLLDDPSIIHAKHYVRWMNERDNRVSEAQYYLNQVINKEVDDN